MPAAREGGRAFVGEKPYRFVVPDAAGAMSLGLSVSRDGLENSGLRPSWSIVNWAEARRFGRAPN